MRNTLAIAQRELNAYFSSPIAYVLIGFFALLFGWFFYVPLAYFEQQSMQAGMNPGQALNINQMLVGPTLMNTTVIMLFLFPLITMRTYAEEKRSGTIELLLTSPITDVEIILGKFLGAMLLYAAMLAVTTIHMAVLFIFGDPEWKPIVTGYLGLLMMGGCFLSLGLFISSLTKNQIVAAMATFAVFLMLWVINWIGTFVGPTTQAVLSHLSLTERWTASWSKASATSTIPRSKCIVRRMVARRSVGPGTPPWSPWRATSRSSPTADLARPQRSGRGCPVRRAPARPGSAWSMNWPTPRHEKSSMAEQAVLGRSVDAVLDRLRTLPGALLPILHAIQDELGYVPPEAVPVIADGLNLSRAEVHGVITFYHDFRSEPPGRHVVHVCRAEACQSLGAEALDGARLRAARGGLPRTTADGAVTLEPVYCLGNCALSPAVMVDGSVYGRVTPAAARRDARRLQGAAPMTRVFVPRDAGALSVGAEAVARAIAAEAVLRGVDVELVRNGSRGLYWLEPLVEVETPAGRIAYGPVAERDVAGLFARRLPRGRHAPAAPRPDGGDSVSRAAGAAHVRARRHHRSGRRSTTTRRTAAIAGSAPGARDGAGGHRRGGDRVGPARPRRRGVPDRHQVEDGARHAGRPEVRRLQRRRGRLGHVLRPDGDGGRSRSS